MYTFKKHEKYKTNIKHIVRVVFEKTVKNLTEVKVK